MALLSSDLLPIQRGGALYKILGSDILSYVQSNIGTSEYVAADIAARNALASAMSVGDRVIVNDATGDATVNAGWAIYQWMGSGLWRKIAEQEGLDLTVGGAAATNLGYTPGPSGGTVTSDTGVDALLPLADGTNAGLMAPANVVKLSHVTVTAATNLDTIRGASHAAVTASGSATTNPIVVDTGQVLSFSIAALATAP
jgi:hypothetical protein